MGQIRAEQGFLLDARSNFLTYAERMQQVDNNESAVEFFHKVFALDINFADVTERLRKLR